MVSKHLELVKRQARDRYGMFASPLSHTAPPPLRHEVESSSRRYTAPPPSHQEEASSDGSMEMWVAAPPTHVDSSGYNDECPHVKEVSSYEH
jgi:hypothetical protein